MGSGSESRWNNGYIQFHSLQVWRPVTPSESDTSSCYSLVDDYKSESISVQDKDGNRVARVNASSPQDQLQFQTGDVLGFYVESNGADSDNDNGVVYCSTIAAILMR